MTPSEPCVIVLTRASRPLRSLAERMGHGGLNVDQRGCVPSGALGSMAARETARRHLRPRRVLEGAALGVCGVLLVGCTPSHSDSAACKQAYKPVLALSNANKAIAAHTAVNADELPVLVTARDALASAANRADQTGAVAPAMRLFSDDVARERVSWLGGAQVDVQSYTDDELFLIRDCAAVDSADGWGK